MTDEEIKIVIGALLHDVGKVIYRERSDFRKHSQSGYDYLKEKVNIDDKDVLNAVKYHHYDALHSASIDNDSIAYIVYLADNIASAVDRRSNGETETGFEMTMPLQSVFNILNGNSDSKYYKPRLLNIDDEINYPIDEKIPFDQSFYTKVETNLTANLKGIDWSEEYINSLLEVLEANLTYVPSSTAKYELADISLFDHLKITAALSSSIYKYLRENNINNYRNELFKNSKAFYDKKTFLLASIDISGIQEFIYTISSKGALKTLRTRSFYLEIMMEHIIDELLKHLSLSRANLISNGGGHCYLLLANTGETKSNFNQYCEGVNEWLLDKFDISLFISYGYQECSSNDLRNIPEKSYENIYKCLSRNISSKKSNRYSAKQIIELNSKKRDDYSRECCVCKTIGKVNEKNTCELCSNIEKFSNSILNDNFFSVISESCDSALPLPGGYYLITDNEKTLKKRMSEDEHFVRAYGKNKMFTGKHIATKLWIGEYYSSTKFDELINHSTGIKRLGVLRADVDNLGQAIKAGFSKEYSTLSRSATLSRQLSLFFKAHINKILSEPEYRIGIKEEKRNVTIVYSGGDDLFIVGAWDDIIELSVDIRRNLTKYTQGILTISGGIGLYDNGYPVSAMAREVAGLEDESKSNISKNSITLLPDGEKHNIDADGNKISDGTYSWDEFENKVIDEKYLTIKEFFENSEDRGKAFLYRILELVRNQSDKINFARYVYMFSRLAPDKNASQEEKDLYSVFAEKMFNWIKNEKDRRHLKTAITLYAYYIRDEEEDLNEN